MTEPGRVLREWFAAWAGPTLEQARPLLAADASITVPGARLRGFDELVAWYRRRREEQGPGFGYALEDLLAGERHAAAVVRLTDGARSWRQFALYEVEDGRICGIWAVEESGQPDHGR